MYRSAKMLAIVLALLLGINGIGISVTAAQSNENDIETSEEAQQSIELTGTFLSDGTFEDEEGESYILADTYENEEVRNLVGEKIKAKVDIVENDEGDWEILINSYDLIQK